MDDRKGFLGSSDISALLGLNPFVTPLQLWSEKTGLIPQKDLSDNESVEWGTRLEKIVAKKFAEKHKVKLIAYKKRFVHPKYLFLTCELDNIIAGTEEICEIKTTLLWNYKEWASPEDVPIYYQCQVQWQLGLSNRKIGWIAVLCGGQKYLEKKIWFDKQIFESMVRKAVDFWENYIIPKSMPMVITADDSDILYQLYPKAIDNEPIVLGDEAVRLAEVISANKHDLMTLKETILANENELKALLKENTSAKAGKYLITWQEVNKKEFTMPAVKYRQLKITEPKGEQNGHK